MKLNDLVTLERGHLSWFRYPTHNIGTYLGRGALWAKIAIFASLDIPDISGYQLGIGYQCVKMYNNENPVTNQKIL